MREGASDQVNVRGVDNRKLPGAIGLSGPGNAVDRNRGLSEDRVAGVWWRSRGFGSERQSDSPGAVICSSRNRQWSRCAGIEGVERQPRLGDADKILAGNPRSEPSIKRVVIAE